jgi:hypothetical protein
VSQVRLILFVLICTSPVILLTDGLIVQGLMAGIIAIALVIAARNLRPGETEFLISIIRWPAAIAAVPALWLCIQVLPLRLLEHSIWKSAETALGHPLVGSISIDIGATAIALGQYLSIAAVAFLSAAVAVDRLRADWILFALTAAGAAIALILLSHGLLLPGIALAPFVHAQAVDCASIGTIAAGAACIRTLERYETRHSSPPRSAPLLLWTFAACSAALAICGAALILGATRGVLAATGCGLVVLACVMVIRWFGFRTLGATAIAVPSIGLVILLVISQPFNRGKSAPLAFAASSTALSERLLGDAPLVGTGAGTFGALAPIYREMDDPPPGPAAATAAASFAIELGKPMLGLIVAVTGGFMFILLRAAFQRRRDSFYPAMGASCLLALLLLAFVNAGLLGTATSLIAAAAIGLGFAQSKSRTA